MGVTKFYPRSGRRAIVDGQDVIERVGESAVVCVPRSGMEIARMLIRTRGYWRTGYAMAYAQNSYTLPDDTEMDIISGEIDLFLEETNDMTCNDLVGELSAIGDAITALSLDGGCGCGANGAGATSPAASPTDTGDIFLATGTPPAGYDDWEQYQIIKCDVASYIVQSLIDDLRYFQIVQIANLTIGAMATGMISIVSGFTLTAILAGLLGILAYSVGMLFQAEEAFVAGFDDLVCAILTGTDAQESIDFFISEATSQLVAAIADPISEFLLIQLVTSWADTIFFNLLYAEYDSVLEYSIPGGADCSACGLGCTTFQLNLGSWSGGLTFASEFSASAHRIELYFNTTGTNCNLACSPAEKVALMGLIGWTDAGAGNDNFRIWSDLNCPLGGPDEYSSDTIPTFGTIYCSRFISILSSTAFTATFERYGKCF